MSAISLLKSRYLGPLFTTQFLGAFTDNMFKQAVALLVVFQATSEAESGLMANLVAGLFILPFFLFSPFAGQLSDKYDKALVLRMAKLAEAPIMLLGAIGFYFNSVPLLMAAVFLMGTQSTFFGPAKYSILPQHLGEEKITAGNGLINMSTFVAIITGTIVAGVMIDAKVMNWVGPGTVVLAAFGYLASRFIPPAPSSEPERKLGFNFFKQVGDLIRVSRQVKSVHLSIVGLSWFWFLGAIILTQAPSYAKYTLGGTESLATSLIAIFVIGIGVGSALCILLSKSDIELGLVPLGAFGMSFFGIDIFLMNYQADPAILAQGPVGVFDFLWAKTSWQNWRVVIDLLGIAICSAFYEIPLFSLVQIRSSEKARSQTIAANNVLNSIFMVASAIFTMGLIQAGLSTSEIFLTIFLMNLAVAVYIFSVIPEFFMRFILWILASTIYELRYIGRDNVPRHGPAVIVANHISFIDWFIITAACRRPVRFVMHHTIFKHPLLNILFRLGKAIPIAPAKEDAALKEKAFNEVSAALRDDQLICIFPEGAITHDGRMLEFRPGVEQILKTDPVAVIPIGLTGLWGSFFSRKGGRAMSKMPKPSHRQISVTIGAPLPPTASAKDMEHVVAELIGEPREKAS